MLLVRYSLDSGFEILKFFRFLAPQIALLFHTKFKNILLAWAVLQVEGEIPLNNQFLGYCLDSVHDLLSLHHRCLLVQLFNVLLFFHSRFRMSFFNTVLLYFLVVFNILLYYLSCFSFRSLIFQIPVLQFIKLLNLILLTMHFLTSFFCCFILGTISTSILVILYFYCLPKGIGVCKDNYK